MAGLANTIKTFMEYKQAYITHNTHIHTIKPTCGTGSDRVCIIQKSSYNGLPAHILLDISDRIRQVNSMFCFADVSKMQNVGFTSYLLKQCFAHTETSFSQTKKVKQTTRFFVREVVNSIQESMALSFFDCSFIRLVCQARHAYFRTGLKTAWKKYAKSSLSTPARFSFLRNQSRLDVLDVTALM